MPVYIPSSAYLRRFAILLLWLASSCAFADNQEDFLLAVRLDNVNSVKEFLLQGMNVNAVEELRGETLLMVALRENSKKVFPVLLADKNIQLEARARNGDTVLMLAGYLADFDAAKALIEHDAEINQPGWCALHYAAAGGNRAIVALLLEKSAYIDAESPNKTTPLMMASRAGKLDIVQLLLEEGADLHLKNNLGLTALDFANEVEQREIAALLTERMKATK